VGLEAVLGNAAGVVIHTHRGPPGHGVAGAEAGWPATALSSRGASEPVLRTQSSTTCWFANSEDRPCVGIPVFGPAEYGVLEVSF
jgi:hypothetical protein